MAMNRRRCLARRCLARRRAATCALAVVALVFVPALPVRAFADEDAAAVKRLLADPQPAQRAAAVRRLAGAKGAAEERLVLATLDDDHPYVRRAAAGVLAQLVDGRGRLSAQLKRLPAPRARVEAAAALGLWLDAEGARLLETWCEDREPTVRAAALVALFEPWRAVGPSAGLESWTARETVVARLVAALEDRDAHVRAEALHVLGEGAREAIAPARWLALQSADADPRVRFAALGGSVAIGGETAVVAVLEGSTDAVWSIRLVAAESAGALRERRVLDRLVAWLEVEPRLRVREAIHHALVGVTGIEFGAEPATWRSFVDGQGKDFDPATAPRPEGQKLAKGTETVAVANFFGLPLVSHDVAFVLDGSSSMTESMDDGRPRHVAAIEAVGRVLDQLLAVTKRQAPQGAPVRINFHRFTNDVETLWKNAERLTPQRRAEALAWLMAKPPAGRTALFDGIAAALADAEVDQIVVLSDGAPSAGAWFTKTDLLTEVARANRSRRARIDVVALGTTRVAARWHDALERLARESGGRVLGL